LLSLKFTDNKEITSINRNPKDPRRYLCKDIALCGALPAWLGSCLFLKIKGTNTNAAELRDKKSTVQQIVYKERKLKPSVVLSSWVR
jgi:hypothetical protein